MSRTVLDAAELDDDTRSREACAAWSRFVSAVPLLALRAAETWGDLHHPGLRRRWECVLYATVLEHLEETRPGTEAGIRELLALRSVQVVLLRYGAPLSFEATAAFLGIGLRTAKRDHAVFVAALEARSLAAGRPLPAGGTSGTWRSIVA